MQVFYILILFLTIFFITIYKNYTKILIIYTEITLYMVVKKLGNLE